MSMGFVHNLHQKGKQGGVKQKKLKGKYIIRKDTKNKKWVLK
jgi:hypothetical protein